MYGANDTWQDRINRAVTALQSGNGIILADDENRENEGDLIYPAERITPEQMAFMIRYCSGIVCLCLTKEKLDFLQLPQMTSDNTSKNGTAFTISIEAKMGVTTGVCAADRVTTIKTAIADDCMPEDLARPGHVFPLRANPGGVLARPGHTEGAVSIVSLAGFKKAAVLCEVMHDDGSMMRLPALKKFSLQHKMPVLFIDDIRHYYVAENEQRVKIA